MTAARATALQPKEPSIPMLQQTFACPQCDHEVSEAAPGCERCGIRLTGPDAHRLWEVDQQIAALRVERAQLIDLLTRPAATHGVGVAARASAGTNAGTNAGIGDGVVSAVPAHGANAVPRPALSGQQVLLGLGALLLLSATAFFLLVVWLVVGLVGQALIMATLTGAAVAGSRWATRRGLPAVAETAAALATGLLLLDLSAAHSLGLAGLDAMPWTHYWAAASALGGTLLLSWDRLVPRYHHERPLRRILTYRPAAAVMLAATPWFLLGAADPTPVWVPAALALVALSNAAGAVLAARLDPTSPATPAAGPEPARRAQVSLTVLVLSSSAMLALAGYALTGMTFGFDAANPPAQRYTVFAALMVAPLAFAAISKHRATRTPASLVASLPVATTVWAAATLGIPLMDATYPTLVVIAVVAALFATGIHLHRTSTEAATSAFAEAWTRVLAAGVCIAQPVLLALVLVVTHSGHDSLNAARTFDPFTTGTMYPTPDPSLVWSLFAASAWALSAIVGAARRRSVGWAATAHLATLATMFIALEDAAAATAWVALLSGYVVTTALACLSSQRTAFIAAIQSAASTAPEPDDALTGSPLRAPRSPGSPFWAGVERVSVAFAGLYAVCALVAAAATSTAHVSATFLTVGVTILLYAATPARLPFAYLGSLCISAGIANVMSEAAVTLVEAYTAPLVVLLAAIGYVQWERNPQAPTRLTMGPALAVAFGPSLLTSLDEGDELRLALVTFAAVAALIVGLSYRWKAPVTTAALVLIAVALTQGGPLTAYVPGWVILGAAGAALLGAGMAWEKAVVAGRRATTWYSALR